MVKETVHIISHSHWDREWYLPLEEHRMRLVELFDDLFDLFDRDPDFKSFHLDGQTIVLEDYLEMRPQNKDRLQKYIDQGKLIIGPFYILQDDYLISSESHVRNHLIGHLDSQKWGKAPKIGYYPDTFGNAGQIPQLLKQSGVDVALFGRGVKPVGFDNQVLSDDHFQSNFSEMIWQGADGSQVLGILFANWYSNGNEIPAEKEAAKEFWDIKLRDVRKYASTSHYLLMNGCDHQPVQKNLSQAIALAQELYPDIDFKHSSFEDYISAVKEDITTELSKVKGELISQETDGWYTLANTASTRIYLKQAHNTSENLLEKIVEPLVVMTKQSYPKDELRYAWKLLLQNAPHDSICGCSVDPVHREMETRYEKVQQVGNFLCQRLLENWEKDLDSQNLSPLALTVFNTSAQTKTQEVSLELVVEQEDFRDGQLEKHYQAMAQVDVSDLALYSSDNKRLAAKIEDLGVNFNYYLPKDAFRSANFARKLKVTFVVEDLAAFSWRSYQLKKDKENPKESPKASQVLENALLRIYPNEKGELVWENKSTGQSYPNFLQFEDCGDLGNEYVFKAPENEKPIFSELVNFEMLESYGKLAKARVCHRLMIPSQMQDRLRDEQKRLIEFRHRKSQRQRDLKEWFIETELILYEGQERLECRCHFDNQMKDHRLRAIFDFAISSDKHYADSIFERVERPNHTHSNWENPNNPQRHRSFIQLQNDKHAMTLSSKGLFEYEILHNRQIALTLLRAVGELGDWGYFPTPDAQCLRDFTLEFAIDLHAPNDTYQAIQKAQAFQTDLILKQVSQHQGTVPADATCIEHPVLADDRLCVTSLKVSEDGKDSLLRYFNLSQEKIALSHKARGVDLLENGIGQLGKVMAGQEIRTEIIEGDSL
ncbi:alpha-mannosidase [Streptococcus iniae]|uniref:alpha-mannosidase n=1 Tax=Streptococcus iniae TaxID=1346 RepID=UPI000EF6CCF3|nr:alpha-mannosidase [Streptococcus iniae]RLU62860.1 alpha-mannosidase [Streptococcus iniae]RLU64203.1 alpha-mannosidase [Streptococcus iniae]RLU72579.1 alpha-mannosidase [Streptococcus iniae]RLU86621.1 alpha-mannosidase [Streptococcus iniae]RLU86645.1 alpha-mannosidase [Streptococcus iniae]